MSALNSALCVLNTAAPEDKVRGVEALSADWSARQHIGTPDAAPPDMPARPVRPELVEPAQVPRRRLGSDEGRAAMLHAIAHIELNAIDLACDMLARFTLDARLADTDRSDFVTDWISVAADEARHFTLLSRRLEQMGYSYGDFPAHNGLWDAARSTRENFAARLAIAPLVLEARGLDVTPGIIKKLTKVNDSQSVAILNLIYEEEVGHVAIGSRWFHYIAGAEGQEPESLFKALVKQYFRGGLKPPFNEEARSKAGLPAEFYLNAGSA